MAALVLEEVRPHLFRTEVPLPRNPLKATNSYIIKGADRNLVIDTGMHRDECRQVLQAAFDHLKLEPERTDYFITHMHADHVGLVDELPAPGSKVYFNPADADFLYLKDLWKIVYTLASRHGFPSDLVDQAIDSHPGQRYSPKKTVDFTMISEGYSINCGSYRFKCIVTPGHTPGHTCLYEPDLKMLLSGDHILGDITPNISTWLDDTNPLEQYFKSLDKIYAMDIDLVLPGHRSLITDCRGRIEELKAHHGRRLEEVMDILKSKGEGSAFKVASFMTWDLVADSWDDFPLMQKWFASGEALAHIRYLEVQGRVGRRMEGEVALFRAH